MKTPARVLVLVGIAVVAGVVANTIHPKGIRLVGNWGDPDQALYKTVAGPEDPAYAGPERAAEAYASKCCVFIDASNQDIFEKGHIPGAVNIPFYEDTQKQLDTLESTMKDKKMIVYCEGPECESGLLLARALKEAEFQVEIFYGGFARWQAAGMPVEKGAAKSAAPKDAPVQTK